MFEFFQDMFNYDERNIGKVDSEDNNGVGVSTVFTSDEGYETALLDNNGVHPVERYESKEEAETGHRKWIEFAGNSENKKVLKLGWLANFVEEREIVLVRV